MKQMELWYSKNDRIESIDSWVAIKEIELRLFLRLFLGFYYQFNISSSFISFSFSLSSRINREDISALSITSFSLIISNFGSWLCAFRLNLMRPDFIVTHRPGHVINFIFSSRYGALAHTQFTELRKLAFRR